MPKGAGEAAEGTETGRRRSDGAGLSDRAESEMSEVRGTQRREDQKTHPAFDEVRQEDMHRERDRQREIQRRYRSPADEDPQDIDVGSNERF
jgi:hypothetical protein